MSMQIQFVTLMKIKLFFCSEREKEKNEHLNFSTNLLSLMVETEMNSSNEQTNIANVRENRFFFTFFSLHYITAETEINSVGDGNIFIKLP